MLVEIIIFIQKNVIFFRQMCLFRLCGLNLELKWHIAYREVYAWNCAIWHQYQRDMSNILEIGAILTALWSEYRAYLATPLALVSIGSFF